MVGVDESGALQRRNNTIVIEKVKEMKPLLKSELPDFLTPFEITQLFQKINPRYLTFFMTLYETGKRVSEVLDLKRNQINLDEKFIRFSLLKKRRRYEQIVYIKPELALKLAVHSATLKADDLVFPFSRQHADYLIKRASKRAGIYESHKRISCHVLRHSFAVNWLEQGLDLSSLMIQLGHSHITTTLIYTKVVNTTLREKIDRFTPYNRATR